MRREKNMIEDKRIENKEKEIEKMMNYGKEME